MTRFTMSVAVAVVMFGSLWQGTNGPSVAAALVQDAPAFNPQDTPTFKARSDLVLLHVTVTDRRGRYVNALAAESFHVFDNGVQRPLSFFLPEDAPATVGLLIDNSQSMQPNTPQVVAAAAAFVRTSHPRDEVFALTFNDTVRPVLGPEAPFTSDPATFRNALAASITPRGRTALHDAIVAGLEYLERGRHERKVLVLVSDGGDNASTVAFDEIVSRVEASNVVVYAVAIVDPVDGSDGDFKHLKTLATETGGNAFAPRSPAQVEDAFARVAEDIRHSYVIAYEPVEDAHAAPLHRIKVEVRTPASGKVIIRTRSAYRIDAAAAAERTP